jgi:hypothetical protein
MNAQGTELLPVVELLAVGDDHITGSKARFVPHSLVVGQLLLVRVMQHMVYLLPDESNQWCCTVKHTTPGTAMKLSELG